MTSFSNYDCTNVFHLSVLKRVYGKQADLYGLKRNVEMFLPLGFYEAPTNFALQTFCRPVDAVSNVLCMIMPWLAIRAATKLPFAKSRFWMICGPRCTSTRL